MPAGPASPLATALRELAPPRHGSEFWTDLDAGWPTSPSCGSPHGRPSGPITQPPPVIDDAKLAKSLKGTDIPSPPGPSSRRPVLLVALAVVVLLVVVAALQSPDDDAETGGDDAPTEATDGRTPTSDDEAAAPADDRAAAHAAAGHDRPHRAAGARGRGPARRRRLAGRPAGAGMTIQVDDSMFRGSGGRCYEARVQGALDLRLRFRAPDGRRSTIPAEAC